MRARSAEMHAGLEEPVGEIAEAVAHVCGVSSPAAMLRRWPSAGYRRPRRVLAVVLVGRLEVPVQDVARALHLTPVAASHLVASAGDEELRLADLAFTEVLDRRRAHVSLPAAVEAAVRELIAALAPAAETLALTQPFAHLCNVVAAWTGGEVPQARLTVAYAREALCAQSLGGAHSTAAELVRLFGGDARRVGAVSDFCAMSAPAPTTTNPADTVDTAWRSWAASYVDQAVIGLHARYMFAGAAAAPTVSHVAAMAARAGWETAAQAICWHDVWEASGDPWQGWREVIGEGAPEIALSCAHPDVPFELRFIFEIPAPGAATLLCVDVWLPGAPLDVFGYVDAGYGFGWLRRWPLELTRAEIDEGIDALDDVCAPTSLEMGSTSAATHAVTRRRLHKARDLTAVPTPLPASSRGPSQDAEAVDTRRLK